MKNRFIPHFFFFAVGLLRGDCCTSTASAEEGPYYKPDAPIRNGTLCEWDKYPNSTQLMFHGRVYSAGCTSPVEAVLDIWSANPNGEYSSLQGPDYTCRGKISTDANGFYQYLTSMPGRYRAGNSLRPAHIHYKIKRLNEAKVLTTQQYFVDDPYLKTDPCGQSCRAGDPTLTVPLIPALEGNDQSYMIRFDIVL